MGFRFCLYPSINSLCGDHFIHCQAYDDKYKTASQSSGTVSNGEPLAKKARGPELQPRCWHICRLLFHFNGGKYTNAYSSCMNKITYNHHITRYDVYVHIYIIIYILYISKYPEKVVFKPKLLECFLILNNILRVEPRLNQNQPLPCGLLVVQKSNSCATICLKWLGPHMNRDNQYI